MITINGCDPLDRGRCAAIIGYKPKDAARSQARAQSYEIGRRAGEAESWRLRRQQRPRRRLLRFHEENGPDVGVFQQPLERTLHA
jgi:hypothetical protein